jgi:hypothetical protein
VYNAASFRISREPAQPLVDGQRKDEPPGL